MDESQMHWRVVAWHQKNLDISVISQFHSFPYFIPIELRMSTVQQHSIQSKAPDNAWKCILYDDPVLDYISFIPLCHQAECVICFSAIQRKAGNIFHTETMSQMEGDGQTCELRWGKAHNKKTNFAGLPVCPPFFLFPKCNKKFSHGHFLLLQCLR